MRFILIWIFVVTTLFSSNLNLSWYSWDGFMQYNENKEDFLKNLPVTNRLFVSFSASEISDLKYRYLQREELKIFLSYIPFVN